MHFFTQIHFSERRVIIQGLRYKWFLHLLMASAEDLVPFWVICFSLNTSYLLQYMDIQTNLVSCSLQVIVLHLIVLYCLQICGSPSSFLTLFCTLMLAQSRK